MEAIAGTQAESEISDAEINDALGSLNINRSNSTALPEVMQAVHIIAALDAVRQRLRSAEDATSLLLLNPFEALSLSI